ncbi:MAG: nucleotide exchange factor GrpE [Halobacteriovoraceae bacterium]|nr:nucleotide exchange factor GrpE [Halobacteriovoraceae bacterium]
MSETSSEIDKEVQENVENEITDEIVQESVEDDGKEQEVKTEQNEEDWKEKYYYLAAEMENSRRRYEREMQNIRKYGAEKILSSLIEVVDNLERTVDAIRDDEDEKINNVYVGVDMVRNQFVKVLNDNGLETIEALGKIFDPNFHEAMAQHPAEGKEDQEVINVFEKGYILNGRLLRAAKVIVAKNS